LTACSAEVISLARDSSLMLAVGIGLVGHQESRPGDDAAGSGRQGRAGIGA
jgi:hypothetical protein